jgi:uncharacterized membrane protein YozB (DUF420 family)
VRSDSERIATIMYMFLLDLHNLLRWVIVIVGVVAVAMALRGAFTRGAWTGQQNSLGRVFTISVDVQLLVGLLLYFVFSPITTGAFADFGAAMKNDHTRFFLVEHLPLMVIAIALIHVGAARARKLNSARPAAIFYTVAMVLMVIAIPWWRPLIPGMG